jgi:hypothetical protein
LGLAYVAAAIESEGHAVTLVDSLGLAPHGRHLVPYPGMVAYGLTIEEIVGNRATP